MRRLQGVKWKNTTENNVQAEKTLDISMYAVSRVILTAVCTIIFIVSACVILSDAFKWAKISGINVLYMILIAIFVSIAMEAAPFIGKRDYVVKWGVLIVGMVCFGLYLFFWGDSKEIFPGIKKIVSLYLKDWGAFYKTNQTVSIVESVDVSAAFNFATLFIFFLMMWLTKMTRKNIIAVIVPIAALLSEFLISLWPEGFGMILMFMGVLLSNTMGWKVHDFDTAPGNRKRSDNKARIFLWIVVGASVLCLWGLVKNIGEPSAKNLLRYADDVKTARKEIVNILSSDSIGDFFENILDVFLGKSEKATAELSNETPEYKNEDVLEMEMREKPLGTIYLKGFDADTYDGGEWSKDADAFEEACRDAGYDPEQISENIANLAVSKIIKKYDISGLKNSEMSTYGCIKYVDASGIRAYSPYFVEKNINEMMATADSGFIKEKGTDSISFYLWKSGVNYDSYYDMYGTVAKEQWELWYEGYVSEHYLDVPDNMKNVKIVAEKIRKQSFFIDLDVNTERLKKAKLVAEWLKINTSYSLNLPELPVGEDCVEYFLGESKTGYCMHFASASVMILRELGVPARYVSGYIAPRDLFKYDSDRYIARIKDNKAHAWVEIYLEEFGWVPVEVTKGYSSQGSITPKDEIPEVEQQEEETTKPEIDEQPTTQKSEIEIVTKDKEENLNEQTTGNVIQTSEQANAEMEENGSSKSSGVFSVLRILAICIAIVAIPVFIIQKKRSNNYNRLQKLIKRKRTLSAIKYINRQIYRKLCLSGKTLKTSLNDAAYGEALKKTYPEISAEEWDKYMDIVKAAAFSRREFSVEEMEFCNAIGTVLLYRGASPCITFGVKRNK